jgi:hypothetical protein
MSVNLLKNDLGILNLENRTGYYKKWAEKLFFVISFTDDRLDYERCLCVADERGQQPCQEVNNSVQVKLLTNILSQTKSPAFSRRRSE